MNITHDSRITDAMLLEINNPLQDTGEPVIPFIWKGPAVVNNIKIQVNNHGEQPGDQAKHSINMPHFGLTDALSNAPFWAIKHAFNFYQKVHGIDFVNSKKDASYLLTACWELLPHNGR